MRRHLQPFRTVDDQLSRYQLDHSERHCQDDVFEVDTATQHPGLCVVLSGEMRFEILDSSLRYDLVCQRRTGEHWQSLDRGKRFVVLDSVCHGDLTAHCDGVDDQTAVIEMQSVDAVKELESHAALSQCLVERCDDDVTHTRGHLPEK